MNSLISVVLAIVGILTALMLLRTLMDMRRMLYTLLTKGDQHVHEGDWVVHRKTGAQGRVIRRQWDGTVEGEALVKFADGHLHFVPTSKLDQAGQHATAQHDGHHA